MDTIWPEKLPQTKGAKYTLVADTIRKAIENRLLEVGSKLPNDFGLYNMHGNVLEWVQDWYESSLGTDPQTDPTGPTWGSVRVVRGGCWLSLALNCRSATRRYWGPFDIRDIIGFRVARSAVSGGG